MNNNIQSISGYKTQLPRYNPHRQIGEADCYYSKNDYHKFSDTAVKIDMNN